MACLSFCVRVTISTQGSCSGVMEVGVSAGGLVGLTCCWLLANSILCVTTLLLHGIPHPPHHLLHPNPVAHLQKQLFSNTAFSKGPKKQKK